MQSVRIMQCFKCNFRIMQCFICKIGAPPRSARGFVRQAAQGFQEQVRVAWFTTHAKNTSPTIIRISLLYSQHAIEFSNSQNEFGVLRIQECKFEWWLVTYSLRGDSTRIRKVNWVSSISAFSWKSTAVRDFGSLGCCSSGRNSMRRTSPHADL